MQRHADMQPVLALAVGRHRLDRRANPFFLGAIPVWSQRFERFRYNGTDPKSALMRCCRSTKCSGSAIMSRAPAAPPCAATAVPCAVTRFPAMVWHQSLNHCGMSAISACELTHS